MRAKLAAVFAASALTLLSFGPTLLITRAARAANGRAAHASSSGHGLVQHAVAARDVPHEDLELLPADLLADPPTAEDPQRKSPPAPRPAPPRVAPSIAAPPRAPSLSGDEVRRVLLARAESLPICRRPDGPDGPGIAEVTLSGDGTARIALTEPYAGTPVGACVARRLASQPIAYDGDPIAVRIRFEL